jgi:hypothetical protein
MKQHFLSQCYLNEFASSDKQFYALNMNLLKIGKQPVPRLKRASEVCYEKDFYTLNFNLINKYQRWGSEQPYALENSFHWYEKGYPAVIKKIVRKQTLTINEAYLLAYAIFDFKVRNKFHRTNAIERQKGTLLKNSFSNITEEITDDVLNRFNIGRDRAIELVKLIDQKLAESPSFGKEMHLYSMLDRKSDPKSAQNKIAISLLRGQWNVYVSPPNSQFITSDNPGFCFDRKENAHNTRFAKGYYCTLPLTPNHCLIITDEYPDFSIDESSTTKTLNYKVASEDFVKIINKGAKLFYNQYLFSNNNDVLLSSL